MTRETADDKDDGGAQRVEDDRNGGEQGGLTDADATGDTTSMSDSATKFQVQIDEETTLSRDDMVEHKEHGPMYVDGIRVGHAHKTVELQSEMGPIGLELSGDEIREEWGKTIHNDPMKLYDDDSMRVKHEGVSANDQDVEVTIVTEGSPENDVEKVHMHALDEIIRAMRALRDGEMPDDVEGAPMSVNWDAVIGEDGDEK